MRFLSLLAATLFAAEIAAAPPVCKTAPTATACIDCHKPAAVAEGFAPNGPTHDGTRAVVDLPASQHMRNTGGIGPGGPGTGAGLCVFTAIEIGSRWSNIAVLSGLQKYMTTREGGGYPEKLDAVLRSFCSSKGLAIPAYVQHTGGDEEFLDRAIATRRAVGVTYAGMDDFYSGPIAHMVTLVHLDEKWAAIIDNNRPGVWVWMTRAEFLRRWRGLDDRGNKIYVRVGRQSVELGGGWGVVLLGPPPPPAKTSAPAIQFGRCGPLGCLRSSATATPSIPPGSPPESGCEWVQLDGVGWVWAKKGEPKPEPKSAAKSVEIAPRPAEVGEVTAENFGVDLSKCIQARRYTLNGRDVPRATALGVFESDLPNDGDRLSLTAVGSPEVLARFSNAVAKLPAGDRERLHVQAYSPESWAVPHFGLPAGISVRKPSGEQVSTLAAGDLTDDALAALIDAILRPKPPAPKPDPVPSPSPNPNPEPSAPVPTAVYVLIALVLLSVILKR